ncbi:MAG: protein-disulfide reductase DsbD family protein [Gammaproteobacteria bacterium]|nr:protein-disulfide reductase DsbD family protein [Gammaproteobacteria bacterium]
MDQRQRFSPRLSLILPALLAFASAATRAQIDPADLLPLSEAFRLEVSRVEPERVRISWTIAEGYYLYRERIRLEATPAGVRPGFVLPPGIPTKDLFFGETEIYRHQVAFEIALEEGAVRLGRVHLKVVSQGCADIGICFPPEAREVALAVGETAVPKARDPFAPVDEGQAGESLFPSPPARSRIPTPGQSP